MNAKPKPGQTLRSDDGVALVIHPDARPSDALLDLVTAEFGGVDWDRDNPVLREAAERVRIEKWFSCTKRWREGEGVEDDWLTSYWSPNGDGGRSIVVAYYPGDVYALGEAADAAERADGAQ